jgi:hypothetical protein
MPPTGFEPTIPASERPHTHALDRAATGIDISPPTTYKKITLIEENVIVQMALEGMFELFTVRAICPLCLPAVEAGPHEMKSFVIRCRDAVVRVVLEVWQL